MIESGKKSCIVYTLYQFSKAIKVSSDPLLFDENMKNKEYSDREIINNLLDRCDEKQLKIIKEVLVAICPNFDDLKKQ